MIADLSLPLLNGMEAANILMLTMHAYKAFVGEAFQVGVALYVLKQSWSNEFLEGGSGAPRPPPRHPGSSPCDAGPRKTIPTDLDTLHALYQQLAEKARRAKERSDMETSMSHTSPPSFFYHRHNQTTRLGGMFLKMKILHPGVFWY